MAETKSDDITVVGFNDRFKSITYGDKSVLKTTIRSTTYSDKSQKHMVRPEVYIGEKSYSDAWDLLADKKLFMVQQLPIDELISILLTKPTIVYNTKTCMLMYHYRTDPVCILLGSDDSSSEEVLKKEVTRMTGQIADLESRVGLYSDEIANSIVEKGDLTAKYEALRVENARFKAALRSLGLMN